MKKHLIAAFAVSVACFSLLAVAGDADVKKNIEAKMGGKVESVTPSQLTGLWEVLADGQIFYTDKTAKYVFLGNMVELESKRNLTAESLAKSMPQGVANFKALPLELAIKQVRGTGKNVLVTFEDPRCGYCKKLAKELLAVKDVTIYTFLLPVLGPESYEMSKGIWCSSDKAKTWNDWMTVGKAVPAAPEKCDVTAIDKTMQLGKKQRVNGTPAMFFATGERNPGYMPVSEIEKRFATGS